MHKIISIAVTFLLFTFCTIFFSACQKEYRYEGGFSNGIATGTAIYTLDGAGNACTASVLSGKYDAGIPLVSNNTVQLLVNVTAIGTYTLTTNFINGIQFSRSGIFTTIGMQTINLKGSGTPVSAGRFTFIPPVGLGCTFSVKVNVNVTPPAIASFTFAGAPNSCTNAIINNSSCTSGIALINTDNVDIKVNVTIIGAYSIHTDTLDGISFSASGIFTNIDNQNITFIGTGTPEFARYLTFSLLSPNTPACAFNLTILNPAPLATYVLESGYGNTTNPCIYTVQGIYSPNISLSDSNTVTMRVYVTLVGNFTISTNTINGMAFSYSGTFTTLGSQYVILKGIGTPLNQGTYIFLPNIVGPHPLGGETCAFDIGVH